MKLSPGEILQLKKMAEQDPAKAGPGWRALSEAQTSLARARTGDKPMTVLTAPGASPNAPGLCAPLAARILIEGSLLPCSPEDLSPETNEEHMKALATLHGVFVHECGHARHTPEVRPEFEEITDETVIQAAILLEEIRMEARVVEERPEDAKWLRASAKNIILENSEIADPSSAISSAILLEGRSIAGALLEEDVAEVAKISEKLLGKETKQEVLKIAQEAVGVKNNEMERLVVLASDLAKLFPKDISGGGPLRRAIEKALNKAAKEAGEAGEGDLCELLGSAKARKEIAEQIAASHEEQSGSASGQEPGQGERQPTQEERSSRNRLAEKFKRVRWRERVKTKRSAALPPGRLRSREALRRSAEIDAGKLATAKPWKATVRRMVPYPKLTMGIIVDTSGSMSYSADALSGSLWAIAHATQDNGGRVAASLFGDTTKTLFGAGKAPRHVIQITPSGGTDYVRGAIELLAKELVWQKEEGPRILTIISDGYWSGEHDARAAIEEARAQGILVLHIGIGHEPPDRGADETLNISSVADLADVLGERAAREMRLW